MARDYAKYKQPSKRNSWNQHWRGRLLLVLFLLFLIGIIISGVYLYKNGYKKNIVNWMAQTKLIFSHPKKTSAAFFKKKPFSQKTGQEPDIHFSFYTELPNMHMMLLK